MIEKLQFVDARALLMCPIFRPPFIVEDLIPCGVTLFCGEEKSGKSWMMLDLAICVAEGQPFLGLPTKKADVLYLSLEDTFGRLQSRLFQLKDEIDGRLCLVTQSREIPCGLQEQITMHLDDFPETKLIIIDTFQTVRASGKDSSYASDYADMEVLKDIADKRQLAIIVVHHVRKEDDANNIFNTSSGTKGLTGAADSNFVLKKENQADSHAKLHCKGRDIVYQILQLRFRNLRWELVSRKTQEELEQEQIPEILFRLVDLIKRKQEWVGSATELLTELGETELKPNVLTKYVNQYHNSLLLDEGIQYRYGRTHDGRKLGFRYCDSSDGSDGDEGAPPGTDTTDISVTQER